MTASPRVLVTGSSGFIGSHLCAALEARAGGGALAGLDLLPASEPAAFQALVADIRDPASLRFLGGERVATVIHLAALAEVVIPFSELADLVATNVQGTLTVLSAARPARLVFASSSAVYGHGGRTPARPDWRKVNPVGSYGMSKAMAEMACAEWARATGGAAVSLRLGNITGAGCRGLIPYLVGHAVKHPDGALPAQARGRGRLVRDYVPVRYAVDVILAAAEHPWAPGGIVALNVGTGRGLTNGEVGAMVQGILRRRGYALKIDWDNPVLPGEARAVVLDMEDTVSRLGLAVPGHGEVVSAIGDAVRHCLGGSR
ncbi:MAG: NAD(P)-dependent oxidoreductase [Candidatus Rokubacteria bacterium]|nr:NAD(P)-dependent oxidoreductase [Candidatus Rokubacteria bacterium]